MISTNCSINDISGAIMGIAGEYAQKIADAEKKNVDIVARKVNEEIKSHITFRQRTGKYVKAFRIGTIENSSSGKIVAWHVQEPHWRLTHLLENGHALPQGGRSRAYPHIKYGHEIAEQQMLKLSEEAIKNAGH